MLVVVWLRFATHCEIMWKAAILVLSVAVFGTDSCNVGPMPGFKPYGIQGQWYKVCHMKPHNPISDTPPMQDMHWFQKLDPMTGVFQTHRVARTDAFPHKCIHIPGVCVPTGMPATYRYSAPRDMHEAKMTIVATDYLSYMIVMGCVKMHKGCEQFVLVFARRVVVEGDPLSKFIDAVIRKKLCMDPKMFTQAHHTSLGVTGCLQAATSRKNVY